MLIEIFVQHMSLCPHRSLLTCVLSLKFSWDMYTSAKWWSRVVKNLIASTYMV